MFIRTPIRLIAALACLAAVSVAGRCDLKLLTVTHLDGSQLLIDGSKLTRAQRSDIQSIPRFGPEGAVATIWIKGDQYRIDEPRLTTITDTGVGVVMILDRVGKVYYIVAKDAWKSGDVDLSSADCRLIPMGRPSVLFGYSASQVRADVVWSDCSLNCNALSSPELPPLPPGLPIAAPAVTALAARLQGLPLHIQGVVSMPHSAGSLHFDWRVVSVSTASFDRNVFAPPPEYQRIDPPTRARVVRMPVNVCVISTAALDSP